MTQAPFTRPTTEFWQSLTAEPPEGAARAPFRDGYAVRLRCGRWLTLPLRAIADAEPPRAVASLIPNQASFDVVDALVSAMAEDARAAGAQTVVGLPTLGFALAPGVARESGLSRFVPLGYSRKFWYDDALGVPVSSLTSPGAGKTLYIDPNQLELVRGKRVVVVDDTVSSGRSLVAARDLLAKAGAEAVAYIVAMQQGSLWRGYFEKTAPEILPRLRRQFSTPHFALGPAGWTPIEGTLIA